MNKPQETQGEGSENSTTTPDLSQRPGVGAIILSTFAAAFGVQTDKNRERDFQHGNIMTFISAGIIFTVVLVLVIVGLVNLIL